MKKFIISFLIFILLLILLDFIGYCLAIRNSLMFEKEEDRASIKFPSYFENRLRMYDNTTLRGFEEENKNGNGYREVVGIDYKKPSIWLFGCSFVYGVTLNGPSDIKDTFGYILSSETKRPVYNRAYPSWGVQHMLYQLKDGKIFEELPEPEYVIFTFIADHARRTQKIVYDLWSDGEYLRYKIGKDGKLEKINAKLTLFWKLYPVKLWLSYLEYNIRLAEENHNINFDLIEKMFEESKDIISNKYPNTKFIILKYNGNDGFDRWFIETDRWSELKNKGFIVIDADKLIGKDLKTEEFLDSDNYHPNPYAWELISKKLAEDIIKD